MASKLLAPLTATEALALAKARAAAGASPKLTRHADGTYTVEDKPAPEGRETDPKPAA